MSSTAAPPSLPPEYPPPPSPPTYDAGLMVIGIILSFCGAILLGLSMPLQRYVLTYPEQRIPVCAGIKIRRLPAWVFTLCIYGAANGLNSSAQQMAPLSLLSSVFTLMIVRYAMISHSGILGLRAHTFWRSWQVFNAVFARLILKEKLTASKLCGGATILIGIVIGM